MEKCIWQDAPMARPLMILIQMDSTIARLQCQVRNIIGQIKVKMETTSKNGDHNFSRKVPSNYILSE